MAALLINPINIIKYTGIIDLINMCYSISTIHLLLSSVLPFVDSRVSLICSIIITSSDIKFVRPEKGKFNTRLILLDVN